MRCVQVLLKSPVLLENELAAIKSDTGLMIQDFNLHYDGGAVRSHLGKHACVHASDPIYSCMLLQRIAVAEACGLTRVGVSAGRGAGGSSAQAVHRRGEGGARWHHRHRPV